MAIDVGGDRSVQWEVDADDTDPGSQPVPVPRPNPGYRLRGKDNTKGPPQRPAGQDKFTVSIKAPNKQDGDQFKTYLCEQGGLRVRGNRVEFDIDIEEDEPHQIQIKW